MSKKSSTMNEGINNFNNWQTEDGLKHKLKSLLRRKESKDYYARKLGVLKEEIDRLLEQIRKDAADKMCGSMNKIEQNVENGKGEATYVISEKIENLDDLIKKCKIDTTKWKITKWVQNYWGNANSPNWQVKVWFENSNEKQLFQESFKEFLSTYKPTYKHRNCHEEFHIKDEFLTTGCLIINKQDAHLNRTDVNGENSLKKRFDDVYKTINAIVYQADCLYNIDKIVYVMGADEFNSEWTSTTTKGTPQENIGLSYQDAFQSICQHNIDVIEMLSSYTDKVEVVYIPGNHDEYVGWHLVNWLVAFFKDSKKVGFDILTKYRKYISYGKSALMFNHGDSIKMERLATIFPIEYKDRWSEHKYFYGFIADKHHEMTRDINGITFYQLPAYATSSSRWEDKHGFVGSRAEATGFLIDRMYGLTNIFKQYI